MAHGGEEEAFMFTFFLELSIFFIEGAMLFLDGAEDDGEGVFGGDSDFFFKVFGLGSEF